MKRTGLNIICSLLLAGGMCACTATPKQTEEIKWSERMAQSEMQRFPEPWMIKKKKNPMLRVKSERLSCKNISIKTNLALIPVFLKIVER